MGFPKSGIRAGSSLTVWVKAKQNDVVGPPGKWLRRMLGCSKGNPDLRGGSVELCSKGGLLGVYPKSHNVPHRLGMGRLMSI